MNTFYVYKPGNGAIRKNKLICLKIVILLLLCLCHKSGFSQDRLSLRFDTTKINQDTILLQIGLKNESGENHFFIRQNHLTQPFCNHYWYFFLKQGSEPVNKGCYVHSRMPDKKSYTELKASEEWRFEKIIKLSEHTYISPSVPKKKYTVTLFYRDAFLRHSKAIHFLESNSLIFYY